MRESVIRYVVTKIDRTGARTLADAAQGRFTYATAEEAERHLRAITTPGNNSPDTLRQVYGDVAKMEVRPCPCYPGHFDPQTCWFD